MASPVTQMNKQTQEKNCSAEIVCTVEHTVRPFSLSAVATRPVLSVLRNLVNLSSERL